MGGTCFPRVRFDSYERCEGWTGDGLAAVEFALYESSHQNDKF